MTSETKKKSRIVEFRNQNSVKEISKASYNDAVFGDFTPSCDMIIKSGQEKHEHYCHRIVLASASPFLRCVLKTSRAGTTPVILLPDINTSVMKFILKYVYNGEVHVPLVSYGDFMEAFDLLHLKRSEEEAEIVTVETEVNDDPKPDSIIQTEQCFVMIDGLPEEFGNGEMIDEILEDHVEVTTEEKEMENTSPNKQNDILDQLYTKLLLIYNRENIDITAKIREHIKNTELVYEDNKLVKAIHSCGVCDRKVTIRCHKSIYWQFYLFKQHIVEVCSEMVKSVPSPLIKRRRTNVQPKEILTDTDDDYEDPTEEEAEDTDDKSEKRKSKNHFPLKIISQDQIDQYKKRLTNTLTAVYERKNVEKTPQIIEAIEKSELVIEDNKLIKAIHFCGLCSSKLSIGYQMKGSYRYNNGWQNSNLMRHLERYCRVKKKNDGKEQKKEKDVSRPVKRRRTNDQPKENMTETEEDDEESTADNPYSDEKSLVSLSKRKSTNRRPLEIISQDQIEQYKKRLSDILTMAYERKNVEITPQIIEAIEKSELVIEDNKLIKAIHFCGRCGFNMSIGYRIGQGWKGSDFMQHLRLWCLSYRQKMHLM